MRIGVVSDSHAKGKRVRKAARVLRDRAAEVIVHCGDIGSLECLELLAEAFPEVFCVAGNMDRDPELLAEEAHRLGVRFSPLTVVVAIGCGQHLVATHGHREDTLQELISGQQFAYVCHGHTHRVRSEQIGPVRVVNPGALHQPRHPGHPTCALIDTDRAHVEHLRIE